MLSRGTRDLAKRALFGLHKLGLKAGLVVLPRHYYTPIADIGHLEKTRSKWAVRSPMHGIDTDPGRQMQWLRDNVLPYEPEYRGNRRYKEAIEASFGPGYGYIEAQCLHGVIRALKPGRIIEVGSGNSSHVMLGALELNSAEGRGGRLTCVEPFPSDYLKANRQIELIQSPVEELDPATFDSLDAGDLLFIDSSHAIRPAAMSPICTCPCCRD
jgi:hypothetical protein